MSTLSEPARNKISMETGMQPGDTKRQIDCMLQRFDVLTTRFDKFISNRPYLYLIGLLLLGEMLTLPFLLLRPQARAGLLVLAVNALPLVVMIPCAWTFNAWRLSVPKTLRDLLEKKHIYLLNENVDTCYLHSLQGYRDALANPKRYFLSSFLMITFGCLYTYTMVQLLSITHLTIFVTLLFIVGQILSLLAYLGGLYCVGIGTWVLLISGQYVRKLVQTFKLRIQPSHTDECGGLRVLGNFCFGLVSPLVIASGLLIGYSFISFISGLATVSLTVVGVGFPLLVILLYIFPTTVLSFILPLWDIHTKMMSAREADEDIYNAQIEAIQKEIQLLLDNNNISEAKIQQEKQAIMETLHTPYPTWPFSLHAKIFSTLLGTIGSLLLGMTTAALPIILPILVHNP